MQNGTVVTDVIHEWRYFPVDDDFVLLSLIIDNSLLDKENGFFY